MQTLTLSKPGDYHVHLRDGAILRDTVSATAQCFSRAVVMPNLADPVDDIAKMLSYYERIMACVDTNKDFTPLMTLYLRDKTPLPLLEEAAKHPYIIGCKLYPAGATTHSLSGIHDIQACYPQFEIMEKSGLPLLIHGEVTDRDVDIFDRETVFIEKQLVPILKRFPALKIVLEHITTKSAVDFINEEKSERLGATITPHHLFLNRNDLFVGGIRPHHYCLPILKRSQDQEALIRAATSGLPYYFLGTDSAPHAVDTKECACGAAGIYSAPFALSLYAALFEQENALDKLNFFAAEAGANFYKLPLSQETLTLIKDPWRVPEILPLGSHEVIPFFAGEILNWKVLTS